MQETTSTVEHAQLEGLRVLILDDDRNTREMLSEALHLYGARVQTAQSVAEGLGLIQSWRPGLTIADVSMPGEDGYDFIRELRALPPDSGSTIPAIALTGYAGWEDRNRLLAAGYDLFVPKPVDLDHLVTSIVRLVLGPVQPVA